MKHNPDDRRDNVDRIQFNINHTIRNMELAEEMMAKTDNEKTRQELKEKNERRRRALEGMRAEIREEALAKEKGYRE
ncbi:MAG: small acid-soluble spore protein Tlp [Peptococcaceae bacterium]|nr:small acid-soluble spore protein Tlp [Peptococcaceae bacterium]